MRTFKDARGKLYTRDEKGTVRRVAHPRHERKRLGLSPRQQKRLRRKGAR